MKRLFASVIIFFMSMWISFAFAETIQAQGTVSTYSEVKRAGEDCETGATAACKIGAPCFARIVIEGEAAHTLYDAMKLHAPRLNGAFGGYYGTQTDAMTCWENNGAYSCDMGYDAVANIWSEAKWCQYE